MLSTLVDRGELELLAVIMSTMPHTGVGAVSTILHHYRHDAVPIGAYKAEDAPSGWHQHHYVNAIAEEWPGPIHDSTQAINSCPQHTPSAA